MGLITTFVFGMCLGDMYHPYDLTTILVGGLGAVGITKAAVPGFQNLIASHTAFIVAYGAMRFMNYDVPTSILAGVVFGFLGFSIDMGFMADKKWVRFGIGADDRLPIRGQGFGYTRVTRWDPNTLNKNP